MGSSCFQQGYQQEYQQYSQQQAISVPTQQHQTASMPTQQHQTTSMPTVSVTYTGCVRFLENPWNSWKIKGVWKILESPGKWPERPGKSWKMKNRNFFKYRDISNTYNPQNFSRAYGASYNAVKQFKKRASVFRAKKLLLAVHEHNVKKIESCQKLDLGCQSFSHPIFRSVATALLSYSSIVIWAFFISCTDQTFCHRI